MINKVITKIFLGAALMIMCVGASQSAVPTQISYQGKLTNNTGQALNGTYNFTFSLYNYNYSTTQSTWTESYTGNNGIVVTNGLYSVQLGSINNSLSYLPFDTTYYLEIQVGTDSPMTPRIPLATSPYAFRSKYADNVSVGAITASSIGAGTLINQVVVTTGSIYVPNGAGASNTTFLRGDGAWGTPSGAGDMSRAIDGVNIANSTASLQNQMNSVGISTGNINNSLLAVQRSTYTMASISINTSQINAGTFPNSVVVTTGSIYTSAGSASNTTFLRGDGTWNTPSANAILASNNTFTGFNTFGQVYVTSITISGANVVLTATAAYATNAAALNGNSASAFTLLTATQSFSGYNEFNQVQCSSLTITGANVVLTATAAYATNAAALNGNSASAFTLLTATQSFSGYNAFNQVQCSSLTITGANVVLTATSAYATNAAALNGNSLSAFALLTATQTHSGYNVFNQVQCSSLTITGANVVLTATAAYASNSGNAAIASSVANGVIYDANINAAAGISGAKLASNLVISSMTATGFVGLQSVTVSQLLGMTPSAVGQLYYCSGGDPDTFQRVYVSTGTTIGSFAKLDKPSSGPGQ